MSLGMRSVVSLVALPLILSGCFARLPIKKDNIIASPLHFKVPTGVRWDIKDRESFVSRVLSGLGHDLYDDIEWEKATELAGKMYDDATEAIDSGASDGKSITATALGNGLMQAGFYLTPWNGKQVYNTKLTDPSFHSEENARGGSLQAVIDSSWKERYDSASSPSDYTAKATIDIDYQSTQTPENIDIRIDKVGYLLECSYNEGSTGKTVPCLAFQFKLDESNLLFAVQNAFIPTKNFPTADNARNKIKTALDSRFSLHGNSKSEVSEKTYRIDFATAKARIQRQGNQFQYDDKQSAFVIEDREDVAMGSFRDPVKRRFTISLFPERNDTVVRFSGEYQSVFDNFTGNESIGKKEFDRWSGEIVSKIDKLLKR